MSRLERRQRVARSIGGRAPRIAFDQSAQLDERSARVVQRANEEINQSMRDVHVLTLRDRWNALDFAE
jgi:hypothetical protein